MTQPLEAQHAAELATEADYPRRRAQESAAKAHAATSTRFAPPPRISHPEMVAALVKPGVDVLASLDAAKADLVHAAIGVSGEAGELLDAVKKHVIYNKPLDRANVVEELGDMEFYMEQLRQRTGISRQETLQGNIAKLSVRYAKLQYSDDAAQARADKAPGS